MAMIKTCPQIRTIQIGPLMAVSLVLFVSHSPLGIGSCRAWAPLCVHDASRFASILRSRLKLLISTEGDDDDDALDTLDTTKYSSARVVAVVRCGRSSAPFCRLTSGSRGATTLPAGPVGSVVIGAVRNVVPSQDSGSVNLEFTQFIYVEQKQFSSRTGAK